MLYLEAQMGLSQGSPAYGTIVTGIQELNPSVMDDVMTVLATRFLVPDSTPAQGAGVFNYIAVTAQRLAELGMQTSEMTKSAADYIKGLPSGQYALANGNDVAALEQAPKGSFTEDIHITTAGSDSVAYIAGPGSSLSVLWPLSGSSSQEKPKSMVGPLVGAVIGAAGGAIVASVPGAIVGGVIGYLVGNAAA